MLRFCSASSRLWRDIIRRCLGAILSLKLHDGLGEQSPAPVSLDLLSTLTGNSLLLQPPVFMFGGERSSCLTPRGKPVASEKLICFVVAANVRLHGASPWHLKN